MRILMKILMSIIVLAASTGESVAQQVRYVKTTGSDTANGLTPATAFRTIQRAVNSVSNPGTTIYVGPGTYSEQVTISSSSRAGATGNPNTIVGDTAGTFTGSAAGEVILDGGGTRSYGFYITGSDNWIFDSLKIQRALYYDVYISLSSSNTAFSFIRCTIVVPTSTSGFGIYGTGLANFAVTSCVFERVPGSQHCTYLYQTRQGNLTVDKCRLNMTGSNYLATTYRNGSTSSYYSYGIIILAYANNSDIVMTNNVASDCYLPMYVAVGATPRTITVSGNTSVGSLYGLYISASSTPGVTISNNYVGDGYYGSYLYAPNGVHYGMTYWNVRYTYATSGWINTSVNTGTVTLTSAPGFTSASTGNFTPTAGSPLIDSGYTNGASTTDILGNSRPRDGDGNGVAAHDRGAFESGTSAPVITVTRWRDVTSDE